MSWSVYILLCADGSFYVGHTADIAQRVAAHNAGKGARFTALRRPVRLVYSETFNSESSAIAREGQLKKWSRVKKQALISDDKASLHALARCRT